MKVKFGKHTIMDQVLQKLLLKFARIMASTEKLSVQNKFPIGSPTTKKPKKRRARATIDRKTLSSLSLSTKTQVLSRKQKKVIQKSSAANTEGKGGSEVRHVQIKIPTKKNKKEWSKET
jgi:hypothetical protein